MYRVSVKIEVLPVSVRRTTSGLESTPELLVQAKGHTTEAAMEKALRILSGEMAAVREAKPRADETVQLVDEEDEDDY